MNPRLVYVVGPSGAGKDSLLHWLLRHPPRGLELHLARRTVSRPEGAHRGLDGDTDEAVTQEAFVHWIHSGSFAMHWSANQCHYGVRHEQMAPLQRGGWVLVSGSRGHLPEARQSFPGLTVVQVQASPETLASRLRARGRETEAEVQARLQRAMAFGPLPDALTVHNDHDIDSAGSLLRRLLFGTTLS